MERFHKDGWQIAKWKITLVSATVLLFGIIVNLCFDFDSIDSLDLIPCMI